ncbi:hypothetical protein HZB06_00890 [Candidatus Wolfebacteria bacterium]|nr:hypothetical protein [Candidatus Wolfebacteria bacterium]
MNILSSIIKDKYLFVIFGLSFVIILAFAPFIYLKLADNENFLIIHFDAYKGIDFFGGCFDVFEILISALAIVSVNLFLADFLYNRERFLSYLFAFVSLTLAILILIGAGVIISIN